MGIEPHLCNKLQCYIDLPNNETLSLTIKIQYSITSTIWRKKEGPYLDTTVINNSGLFTTKESLGKRILT